VESLMDDGAMRDALVTLAYALDEMRETTSLLPVAEASRSLQRSKARNFFFMFARSRAEVTAGFAMQYLDENLDRARAHWREALSSFDDLQRTHGDNELVATLATDLRGAGLLDVLAQLQPDAIPRPVNKTAVHLAAVVATIRNCENLTVDARNKLTLERMRDE
jgi:hypothetical protein